MNHSVKLPEPCEFINIVPLNPLISKCQIKVCWVGDEPNRNKSIITKETAVELANSLPGSPIVGYYNEKKQDFEGHNRSLDFQDGQLIFKDETRPYGFVDLSAKVWFQKFLDNGVEHEYLMTEGWLWTGQYPECKRIIEKGNNQSMELDEKIIDAYWTKDDNGNKQFFIINEAIMSKLCILGEDVEPCFEGASISKVQFSFEDSFKEQLFSMIDEIKNMINKGGVSMGEMEKDIIVEEEPVVEEPAAEPEVEPETVEEPAEEPVFENKEDEKDDEPEEDICPECGKPVSECECPDEEEDKKKYNLEEIEEYVSLRTEYEALKSEVEGLNANIEALNAEKAELVEFKLGVERERKEALIKSFYMLDDSDKAEVQENIDNYSLDEIEAKLCILCVRNKVDFSLDSDNKNGPAVFDLEAAGSATNNAPDWVKALQAVAKN